jgi:hypothetical protein
MIYSSTNFFVVVVDAFTISSSLCSTGQQLFILICSAVQPTQIIQYVEDASECRLCYRSFTKYIYIPIVPQCLVSHRNCDPPPPLSSCSSPKGGGHTLLRVRGWCGPKVHIYLEYHKCMAPHRNCDPPPLTPSLLSLLLQSKGGGDTLSCGWRGGVVPIPMTEEKA